ncbi:MAG: hypothetical protein J6386_11925 [Candidatus Synoicihabitans palmerolidicus]|nr:hypothetical protein [Candidatus Synoicihabitans palmerolidicus]
MHSASAGSCGATSPRHVRLRVVRADAGFCPADLLALWEELRVKFIVAARLTRPVKSQLCGETRWRATDIDGTEVTELGPPTANGPPHRHPPPRAGQN